jgi:hypothetical protein
MLTYIIFKGLMQLKQSLIQKWNAKTAIVNINENHMLINDFHQEY